jgi:hypothetical protein
MRSGRWGVEAEHQTKKIKQEDTIGKCNEIRKESCTCFEALSSAFIEGWAR